MLNHRKELITTLDLNGGPISGDTTANVARRNAIRDALRAAAAVTDTDADGLPDYWELDEYGSLTSANAATPTAGGLTALLAYATGQSTKATHGGHGIEFLMAGEELTLIFPRRLARRPALRYTLEISPTLADWTPYTGTISGYADGRFDGTGTEIYSLGLIASEAVAPHFRLRVSVLPGGPP